MGTPQIKVPTAESVPGYARSFAAAPSESVGDGLSEMMSQLEAKQADTQSQLSGMGKQPRSVPGPESAPSFVKSEFRAPAPSQPAPPVESEVQTQPQGRKITVTEIEEPAPVQQSMKPMDVAERLRRIQTSGRPTARQEAQDFLASIKSQMSNG